MAWHYYWSYGVLTKRDLLWLHSGRHNKQVKDQMQIFTSNHWTEAADPCGWMRERLKKGKEEGYSLGGPAVSGPLRSQKHWTNKKMIWGPQYIYSRALPILGSEKIYITLKRLEVPGSLEVWCGEGWRLGKSSWRQGCVGGMEVWDAEQLEGEWGGWDEWNLESK